MLHKVAPAQIILVILHAEWRVCQYNWNYFAFGS